MSKVLVDCDGLNVTDSYSLYREQKESNTSNYCVILIASDYHIHIVEVLRLCLKGPNV